VSTETPGGPPSEPGRVATAKTVTLYTFPVCGQCTVTKLWLDKADAEYTVVDLSTSPADAAAVAHLGYQRAPVVVVSTGDPEKDIHWSGFQPDFLQKYVGSVRA
jgi:glutaredoxin-like protein NrdH